MTTPQNTNPVQVTEEDKEVAEQIAQIADTEWSHLIEEDVQKVQQVLATYRSQIQAELRKAMTEQLEIDMSLANKRYDAIYNQLLKVQEQLSTMRDALEKTKETLENSRNDFIFAHHNWPDMFHDAIGSCRMCRAAILCEQVLTAINAALK